MGVRIIFDREEDRACLFDSVTGTAFGPVFERDDGGESGYDQAVGFLDWLHVEDGRDARVVPEDELARFKAAWRESVRVR